MEFTATAPDRHLRITYGGRSFELTAYSTDLGVWQATVHEVGTDEPAQPASDYGIAGLYRDPWSALSLLTDAIIREVEEDADGR